jgi:hypothetical protein
MLIGFDQIRNILKSVVYCSLTVSSWLTRSPLSRASHIYICTIRGRFYQSQLLYSSQQRVHGSVNKVVFAICFTRGFNLKSGHHVSDTIVKPAMHAEACGNYSSDTSVEAMWSGLNPRVDGLIFPVCQ